MGCLNIVLCNERASCRYQFRMIFELDGFQATLLFPCLPCKVVSNDFTGLHLIRVLCKRFNQSGNKSVVVEIESTRNHWILFVNHRHT